MQTALRAKPQQAAEVHEEDAESSESNNGTSRGEARAEQQQQNGGLLHRVLGGEASRGPAMRKWSRVRVVPVRVPSGLGSAPK